MSATERDGERVRALLDERSAALARRGRAEERAEKRVQARLSYLVCALGGERYGLPVAAVASVLPARACTPVPGAPPALRGIVTHAGAIVSVIDPGRALGLDGDGEEDGEERAHLVLLRAQEPPVALAVDRVLGLADIPADAVGARVGSDGAEAGDALGLDAVSGYAPAGADAGAGVKDGFAVLDPKRLLRPFLP